MCGENIDFNVIRNSCGGPVHIIPNQNCGSPTRGCGSSNIEYSGGCSYHSKRYFNRNIVDEVNSRRENKIKTLKRK